MKERTREERETIAETAERQMRRWLLTQEIDDRKAREIPPEKLAQRLGPYITVSREAGAGGGQIARIVADKLGWELLDKQLLDFMAERYRLPRDLLDFVDETTANWMHEMFGSWLDRQVVSQDTYVQHLGKIILTAAKHGRVVVVGRGAQFILPREKGLAARIIAPEQCRIEQTMQRRGMDHGQAKRYVEETDRGRREFVRRYFHHDVTDPHLYDLVINVAQVGAHGAAAVIVAAYEQLGRRHGEKKPL